MIIDHNNAKEIVPIFDECARDLCCRTLLLIKFHGITYGQCNDNGPANATVARLNRFTIIVITCAIVPMKRRYDCDVET